MPSSLTHPGVYIEELPSGVRTITGVATSIAAFVGRSRCGPVDLPRLLHSWADFERQFGGLWQPSTLGYAVRDFYRNGGREALILRLFAPGDGGDGVAQFTVSAGVSLAAASPGSWGANLRVTLDNKDVPAATPDRFNLSVIDASPGGRAERILGVSLVGDSPRRIDLVLEDESDLVRWDGASPAVDGVAPTGGSDPVSTALADLIDPKKALKAAQKALKAAVSALASGGDPSPQPLVDAVTAAKKDLADKEKAVATAAAAVATAVEGTGAGDGDVLRAADFAASPSGPGLTALDRSDLFNLLCIPPHVHGGDIEPDLVGDAAAYCVPQRAMLIVDPPAAWRSPASAVDGYQAQPDDIGTRTSNAAIYFPRLRQPDPERGGALADFVPCGAVAGVFARTDAQRGVWKAPAGLEATLVGAAGLTVPLTDPENGDLNQLGINCLRSFGPAGRVVWGARTLRGADRLADEWKYVPVRRTALFIEESLFRGTQWVVFEPNDAPLWAQIRLAVGAFMNSLFRQGAFKGRTPKEAYFVRCDGETTTQNDIDLGVVNIAVGFAPLKPAEFVVIKFQQTTGQVQA